MGIINDSVCVCVCIYIIQRNYKKNINIKRIIGINGDSLYNIIQGIWMISQEYNEDM